MVRIVLDRTSNVEFCLDQCKSYTLYCAGRIGFSLSTSVDLGHFLMLEEFCVEMDESMDCDDEMEQQYSQLCSVRGEAEVRDNEVSEEDAITVRTMLLPVITAKQYAFMLVERWAEFTRMYSKVARSKYNVPSHAQIVMEFYEEQMKLWSNSIFCKMNFESYLVDLQLAVTLQSFNNLLTR